MERLRKEIRSVLGDDEHPTREHVKKMPYLALVIKESECLKVLLAFLLLRLLDHTQVSDYSHQYL